MANKGQVVVFVTGDTKDLSRSLGEAEKKLGEFGGTADKAGERLSSVGKKMTMFATVPIAAAMGLATKAASNLEQSMGAVDSVFGESRGTIDAFADTAANAAGLSKREVNEMAAVIGASLKGMGFETGEAATKVVELEKRAADMAATFGGSTQQAIEAIASLMRGERDPIEKFGVSIKAVDVNARIAAMGLDTSTAASKKQSEAMASLDLLMAQTADTAGAFAREQDTTAGATARAKAELENAAASMGETILPIASKVAGGVADIASAFGNLPDPVQTGVVALAGVVAATGPILTVVGNLQKLRAAIGTIEWSSLASRAAGPMAAVAGAAVVGATAFALWSRSKEEAKRRTEEFIEAVRADNGVLGENTQALILNRLEQRNQTDDLARAGVAYEDLQAAIGETGGKYEGLIDALATVQWGMQENRAESLKAIESARSEGSAREKLIMRLYDEGEANAGLVRTLREVFRASDEAASKERSRSAITKGSTSATESNTAATEENVDALEAQAEAKRRVIESSIGYERSLLALESANQAVTEAQRGSTSSGKSLVDRQRELQDAARGVEDAQRAVADAHRGVEDAQRGVEDATGNVKDALRAQADAALRVDDAMRGITDAERGVVDAQDRISESARRLVDAQDGVADAQQKVLDLQRDLDRLLKGYGEGSDEAAEATENLDDRQRDLQRSQLGVTSAQEKLNEVRADGTSSAYDIARAELDLADAEDRLEDATAAVNEAQTALTETINGVPASSDKAKKAQEDLAAAEDDLEEAERRVTQAAKDETEAHRGLETAHRGVERASRDLDAAQRGVTEAAEGVKDAHRGVADAARDLDEAHRGVSSAVRDAQRAQEDRAEALRGDTSAPDATGKQRDLERALLDQREAYIAVADAYVERAADIAEANGKTLTAEERTRLFKEKLHELMATLAPDSPLRIRLGEYIGQVDNLGASMKEVNEVVAVGERFGGWVNGISGLFGGGGTGDGPGAVGGASTAFGMASEAAAMFGGRITSGYRSPGRNAAAGGSPTSYHLDPNNPAQDLAGGDMQGMFDYLAANYGSQVRELIYGNTMVKRGRRMPYRRNDHWDHVHVAHDGGLVSPTWPTMLGLRGDERPAVLQVGERVVTKDDSSALVAKLDALIAAVERNTADRRQQADRQIMMARSA